jgi:hypothetical protein
VVAVALIAAFLVLPRDPTARPSRLDVPGAALFTVVLLALLIALSQGNDWGWSSGPIVALLVVTAVTLLAWVRYELRAPAPLVVLFFAVEHAALSDAFVAMGITGVGIGFSFGAMPSLIIASVPRAESGSAMGLYQVLRTTGFATGSALCAAILAAFTSAHQTTPSVGGYQAVLLVGAALCAGSAALSLLLPGHHGRGGASDPQDDDALATTAG